MKKISVKQQKQLIKSNAPSPIVFEYDGLEIHLNPTPTLDDAQKFATLMWDFCFCADDEGVWDYRPYMSEVAIRIIALKLWTNIDVDLSDLNQAYAFVMNSGIYDEINAQFNSRHREIICSAEEYVKYRYDLLLKPSTIDDLIEVANVWLGRISEQFESMNVPEVVEAIKKINKTNDDEKILEMIFRNTEDDNDENTSTQPTTVSG